MKSKFCFFAFFASISFFQNSWGVEQGVSVTDSQLLHAVGGYGDIDQVSWYVFCGAEMIAPNYAITADHCPVGSKIFLAAYQTVGATWEQLDNTACKVIAHAQAPWPKLQVDGTTQSYAPDLRLLKIDCPQSIASQLSTFELPEPGDVVPQSLNVAGFGVNGQTFLLNGKVTLTSTPQALPQYDVKNISNLIKQARGSLVGVQFFDPESKPYRVCLNLPNSGFSLVSGDSGGPQYLKTATGYKLFSVNSNVFPDVKKDDGSETAMICGPSIAQFTPWIKSMMQNDQAQEWVQDIQNTGF